VLRVVAPLFATLSVFGCESEQSLPKADGSVSPACIERPEKYAANVKLDRPEAAGNVPLSTPNCVPTCGAPTLRDGYPSVVALPAGACADSTPRCVLTAIEPCDCEPSSGPVSQYLCACVSGRWECDNVAAGASGCACDDAGAG